ncbi:MAG: glycosyltransferase [Chloroflexota bacterium]|nr:MAG: glycosyltransferase [Chloroflexota bacterium]
MITVGIAAYNAAETLPLLLESLLAQEYPRAGFEVVVADNGSSDETTEIVRQYARRGPIRLLHADHRRGPAVARNTIVAAALGDIIAFTDSDCCADARWLAEIRAGFSKPEIGCVAGGIQGAEAKTPVEGYYCRHNILSQETVLNHPFLPYAQTANAAFRREVFQRVGPFDETLLVGEDLDLLWRMQLETEYRLCYCQHALVWHRHRSTLRGFLRHSVGWGVCQALIYKKYRGHLRRDSWSQLLCDYRRIGGLLWLTLRRWVGVKLGHGEVEVLQDTYLTLFRLCGIKLGRWKGSLVGQVFYP